MSTPKDGFYKLRNGSNAWFSGGAEPPEGSVYIGLELPPTPLATLITNALTRIDQAHAEFLLKAVGNPTQVEINTWPLKLEIKNAILAEFPLNQEQQAFVDSAGLDTPAKQTAWAQSVQAKSAYSAHATGVAEAVRDTAKELVKAAQTAEELAEVMQELTALAEQKLAEVLALKG